jgi:hypothetical protein
LKVYILLPWCSLFIESGFHWTHLENDYIATNYSRWKGAPRAMVPSYSTVST